ncbi:MAG: hypothetical protein U0R80_03130 [Nocardioidaceae bacterium]
MTGENTPKAGVAEPTVAELLAMVQALVARVDSLEAELAAVRADVPVPDEVVLAISAAVAAFLGHRAKLKQVRYRSGAAWTQQGRAAVQGHRIMHGVR